MKKFCMQAESAGAYLATYVAAMKNSKALQDAIGYPPTRMRFRAMGLISGMFYTNRNDALGWVLSRSIYGSDERNRVLDGEDQLFHISRGGEQLRPPGCFSVFVIHNRIIAQKVCRRQTFCAWFGSDV